MAGIDFADEKLSGRVSSAFAPGAVSDLAWDDSACGFYSRLYHIPFFWLGP
jgi:hypothetical protein